MKQVGVREIRQHASTYLEGVAGGEPVLITSRGRPVAVILPLGEALADALRPLVTELVDAGVFASLEEATAVGVDELVREIRNKLIDDAVVDGYRRMPERDDNWLDDTTFEVVSGTEWRR